MYPVGSGLLAQRLLTNIEGHDRSGAGFEIEVYDAATLKHEKTWNLNVDVTYAGIVVTP